MLLSIFVLSACGHGSSSVEPGVATPSTQAQASPSANPTSHLGPNLTQYPEVCELLASLIASAEEGAQTMNAAVLGDGTCSINTAEYAPGTKLEPVKNSSDDTLIYELKDTVGNVIEVFYVVDSQVIVTLLYQELPQNPSSEDAIPPTPQAAPRILLTRQIHFEAGESQILKSQERTLDTMARAILDMIQIQKLALKSIEVQGHTDDLGSARLRLRLSQQRAESVRSQLLIRLKRASQEGAVFWEQLIRAQGYGSGYPVSGPSAHGPQGEPVFTIKDRNLNRRVEIHFTY